MANEKDAATAAVEAIALAIARAEAAHRAASEEAFGRKVERLAGAIESALGEQPPPDPVAPTPQPAAKSRWWGGGWRPAAYSAALATLLAILLAFAFFSADDTPPVKQAAVAERSAPPPLAEKSANEAKIYPLAEESASDMAAQTCDTCTPKKIELEAVCTDHSKFSFKGEIGNFSAEDLHRSQAEAKNCPAVEKQAARVFSTKRPERQAVVVKIDPPVQKVVVNNCVPYTVDATPSAGGYKYVFVTNEDDARCLAGKKACGSDCQDWIRGRRGSVQGPASLVRGSHSLAYRVTVANNGTVMMPRNLAGPVAWCDTALHGNSGSGALIPL